MSQLSKGKSVESLSNPPDPDQALMLQVKSGNRAAFEKLYGKYKGPIMSYVASLVQKGGQKSGAVEEITQEVFLKIYRTREAYEPKAKFSTWLWTIAHNTSIDHLRKQREVAFEDPESESVSGAGISLESIESPVPDAEAMLLEQVDQKRIDHCMGGLSEGQKQALMLRTLSEMPYEEISKVMKCSLSSVKSLIFRAKNSLIECLKVSV